MNCGTCKHWSPEGELGRMGFGICKARQEPHRSAITTSAQAMCRIGKFAKADRQQLQQREHAQGTLL
ncbi:hypothetical protein ACQ858_08350 [Variovorax ureilyticus]|uniref:hypothetical protein n=1 Tax=Variovorax ureilyticus TaxID=1836198 RepID=UPI003D664D6A